ncbi:outer membrane beta-barrel protein [uncultured Shewanella sp.]|uniref:outer membrane beta-barrel protein n=1 Tax=uncultured Shewanella sp. TaxID=173975 RepID=UPI00262219E5|nr:outer membrane beta-barrel protein [uncultured Shewanella sp.]
MNKTTIAAMILTTAHITQVHASTEGFYLGGQFGTVKLSMADVGINNRTNSYGLHMGYQFNDILALEAGISTNVNTTDKEENIKELIINEKNYSFINSTYNALSLTHMALGPKISWQFNDTFSAFTTAGISYTKINTKVQFITQDNYYPTNETITFTDDYTGVGYYLGVGLNATISHRVTCKFSYEHAKMTLDNTHIVSVHGQEKVTTTLSQLSLGLNYTF